MLRAADERTKPEAESKAEAISKKAKVHFQKAAPIRLIARLKYLIHYYHFSQEGSVIMYSIKFFSSSFFSTFSAPFGGGTFTKNTGFCFVLI